MWRWSSDAFGASPPNSDPDGNGSHTLIENRFAGQYHDAESGLHYNGFRYFNPDTGRYMSSDPIGLSDGMNTYGYAMGNPLFFLDLFGMEAGMFCHEISGIRLCEEVDNLEEIEKEARSLWENVSDMVKGQSCEAFERKCRRALGPSCYFAGSPCSFPCIRAKMICDDAKRNLPELPDPLNLPTPSNLPGPLSCYTPAYE